MDLWIMNNDSAGCERHDYYHVQNHHGFVSVVTRNVVLNVVRSRSGMFPKSYIDNVPAKKLKNFFEIIVILLN